MTMPKMTTPIVENFQNTTDISKLLLSPGNKINPSFVISKTLTRRALLLHCFTLTVKRNGFTNGDLDPNPDSIPAKPNQIHFHIPFPLSGTPTRRVD
ncbi:Uncharacterized protein TCM_011556 [Theobroma cacao]|uniref:Uncharacterized protein n=1 Tax=Theobroma cacao TaxID=3641 RepID=A0A061EHG9_THECC|nr:Uncharacterized protein TCM_011556 [Theobroma cacao]